MELNKYKRLTKSQQQLIQQQQDIITTQEIQLDTLSRQLFDTKQKLEIIRKKCFGSHGLIGTPILS